MKAKTKETLYKNRKAYFFLGSQAVSLIGSSLVQYAIMWTVTLRENSGAVLATYMAFSMLPQLIVSLFGGAIADRYSRKNLIMLADGGIAIATLGLFFILLSGTTSLIPVYLIAGIRSLGAGFQTPAVSALLPELCEPEQLMKMNSLNGTVNAVVTLVTPAAAAALLNFGDLPPVLLVDVVTAAIAILILWKIKVPKRVIAEEEVHGTMIQDIVTGIKYASKSYFLRTMLLWMMLINFLFVPGAVFNVLFTTRMYGDNYLYLTIAEVVFSAGAIVGGVLLAIWGGFKNRMITMGMGLVVVSLVTVGMGLVPPVWLYFVLLFIFGFCMPVINTVSMVLFQEKVEPGMLGRVMSLSYIVSMAVMLIGTVTLGPVFDVIPMQWIVLLTGVLMVLVCLPIFVNKRILKEGMPLEKVGETVENIAAAETAVPIAATQKAEEEA